jgi:uncharacterized membrane protein
MLGVLLFIAKKNLYLGIIILIISLWILQSLTNPFPYLENFENSSKKQQISTGIDLETVKQSVQAQPSNSIRVNKKKEINEPKPYSTHN